MRYFKRFFDLSNQIGQKDVTILLFLICVPFCAISQETLRQQKNEFLFQSGLTMTAHYQYGASFKMFHDYVEKGSSEQKKMEATYNHAICAYNLFHRDRKKLLENLIETYPFSLYVPAGNLALANLYYTEKKYFAATTYFSKIDFDDLTITQQSEGHFRWAYSYFSLRQFAEALDQFNTVKIQSNHYSFAASYYAGYLELNNGDYANALIDFKRADRKRLSSASNESF